MVDLKYERLFIFCFVCGMIGYIERDCVLVDEDIGKEEYCWGIWFKVLFWKGFGRMWEEVKELVGSKKIFVFYMKLEGMKDNGGIKKGVEIFIDWGKRMENREGNEIIMVEVEEIIVSGIGVEEFFIVKGGSIGVGIGGNGDKGDMGEIIGEKDSDKGVGKELIFDGRNEVGVYGKGEVILWDNGKEIFEFIGVKGIWEEGGEVKEGIFEIFSFLELYGGGKWKRRKDRE